MICLTDKTIICANCALFGDHKSHEIKLLSDYEELANMKKTQLSSLTKKISTLIPELETSIEEKKQILKDKVKEMFSCLHAEITRQEFQVLFQLENMFLEEKTKLEEIKFGNRASEILLKLEKFSNIMSNPNIATLLQEDFTELETTIIEELSTAHSKKTQQISNLFAIFDSSLSTEDLLKSLNIIDPLDKKLLEFNKRSSQQLEEFMTSKSITLSFDLSLGSLKVHKLEKDNYSSIQRSELEKVQEVDYKFPLDKTTEEDSFLTALIRLSKLLPNRKSVKLFVKRSITSDHSKRILHNILSATLIKPENLEKLEITFDNYECGDLQSIFLAERILPRIKDLKAFSLNLPSSRVSSQFFKALSRISFGKIWPNLETFRVNGESISILNEKDISEFLNIVPNVKDLSLGFERTPLTDQALEMFSTKILPSLGKLESFSANFSITKLTSSGVEKFLMNIPNVKDLSLKMIGTAITDDVVKLFLETKLRPMFQLKRFHLAISKDYVSENAMREIRYWEKKIAQ